LFAFAAAVMKKDDVALVAWRKTLATMSLAGRGFFPSGMLQSSGSMRWPTIK